MVIKKKAINSTFALKIKIRDPNPTREGREEKKTIPRPRTARLRAK